MPENSRPFTRYLDIKARQNKITLCGNFELSPVCNFSCRMCYIHKTPEEVAAHPRHILTLKQWKHIGDMAVDSGMLFLLLTGGEPFLWPNLRELYEYMYKKGTIISINSNGSLISKEITEWLKDSPPTRINITLYGASSESYEKLCGMKNIHRKVMENIDMLLKAGIHVKLNATMTPYNISDLSKIVQFAKERDLLFEISNYTFPPIRRSEIDINEAYRFTPNESAACFLKSRKLTMSVEKYHEYLEQVVSGTIPSPGLKEIFTDPTDGEVRCSAGRDLFWITWDGYMLPCGMTPEPKVDILNLGFTESWKQITRQTGNIRLSGVCKKCPNKNVCHSCMAAAYAERGSADGIPTYLCRMVDEIRAQAEESLKNWVNDKK